MEQIQDPGKDLFAYLFVMIMVFVFMVMLTSGSGKEGEHNQDPTRSQVPGKGSLTSVSDEKLGRLVRDGEMVLLDFNGTRYDPLSEVDRLVAENRIVLLEEAGEPAKRVLYLLEEESSRVLLSEYLTAFQAIHQEGIGIAFAETAP